MSFYCCSTVFPSIMRLYLSKYHFTFNCIPLETSDQLWVNYAFDCTHREAFAHRSFIIKYETRLIDSCRVQFINMQMILNTLFPFNEFFFLFWVHQNTLLDNHSLAYTIINSINIRKIWLKEMRFLQLKLYILFSSADLICEERSKNKLKQKNIPKWILAQ